MHRSVRQNDRSRVIFKEQSRQTDEHGEIDYVTDTVMTEMNRIEL